MGVLCIRCRGADLKIITVDDKAAKVECQSCGAQFTANVRAAAEVMRHAKKTEQRDVW